MARIEMARFKELFNEMRDMDEAEFLWLYENIREIKKERESDKYYNYFNLGQGLVDYIMDYLQEYIDMNSHNDIPIQYKQVVVSKEALIRQVLDKFKYLDYNNFDSDSYWILEDFQAMLYRYDYYEYLLQDALEDLKYIISHVDM